MPVLPLQQEITSADSFPAVLCTRHSSERQFSGKKLPFFRFKNAQNYPHLADPELQVDRGVPEGLDRLIIECSINRTRKLYTYYEFLIRVISV